MRDKWDERHSVDGRTYGQMTVEKALTGRTAFHQHERNDKAYRNDDISNAERLNDRHGCDLLWCDPWKTFLV